MYKQFSVAISLVILAISLTGEIHAQYTRPVKLKGECFFELKKRKVVDTLINKVAVVNKKGAYFILTIDSKKYLACNLPNNFNYKKVLITGYVLQTLSTEKNIATPLKIIKAFTM